MEDTVEILRGEFRAAPRFGVGQVPLGLAVLALELDERAGPIAHRGQFQLVEATDVAEVLIAHVV